MSAIGHNPPPKIQNLGDLGAESTARDVPRGGFVAALPPAPVTENVGTGAEGTPGAVR